MCVCVCATSAAPHKHLIISANEIISLISLSLSLCLFFLSLSLSLLHLTQNHPAEDKKRQNFSGGEKNEGLGGEQEGRAARLATVSRLAVSEDGLCDEPEECERCACVERVCACVLVWCVRVHVWSVCVCVLVCS